jgi:hypothetical protein
VKCGVRVALGVAGGYLLGRTKKMKLALMLGSMVAGRRAGGPGALVGQASKLLGESPEMARLSDELRGRLVEAAKGAALAVAARQVESLADRLTERLSPVTDAAEVPRSTLQETVQSDEDRQHEPAARSDEYDAEPDGSGSARSTGGEEEEEQAPPPRRSRAGTTTARAPARAATATLKRTSATTGSAGRAAAKATAGRKGGRTARSRGSGSDD